MNISTDYIFRRATIEDREEIFRFLSKAYKGRAHYKYPERWYWQFVDNPFKVGEKQPSVWVALRDSRVVAQTCAIPVEINFLGKSQIMAWAVDGYVLKEHRQKRIISSLLHLIFKHYPLVGGLWFNEVMGNVWLNEGGRVLEKFPIVVFSFKSSIIKGLKSYLYDRRFKENKDIDIQEAQNIDKRFDELWANNKKYYPITVKRSNKYLKWRYIDIPHATYKILIASRKGELIGYIIFRMGGELEPKNGVISDLFTNPNDDVCMYNLVRAALDRLRSLGMEKVNFATNQTTVLNLFIKSLQFRKNPSINFMLRPEANYPQKNEVYNINNWFLTKGDSDADQVPFS